MLLLNLLPNNLHTYIYLTLQPEIKSVEWLIVCIPVSVFTVVFSLSIFAIEKKYLFYGMETVILRHGNSYGLEPNTIIKGVGIFLGMCSSRAISGIFFKAQTNFFSP